MTRPPSSYCIVTVLQVRAGNTEVLPLAFEDTIQLGDLGHFLVSLSQFAALCTSKIIIFTSQGGCKS